MLLEIFHFYHGKSGMACECLHFSHNITVLHVELLAFKVALVEIKCKGCGIRLMITSLLSCIPSIFEGSSFFAISSSPCMLKNKPFPSNGKYMNYVKKEELSSCCDRI